MRHTAHILFTYILCFRWRPLFAPPKLVAATRALSPVRGTVAWSTPCVVVDADSAGAMSSQAWLDEEADEEVDEEVDVCWAKNTE